MPVGSTLARAYPRDWHDFLELFSEEEACRAYLADLRWGAGFTCPACHGTTAWTGSHGLRICRTCRRHVSITAGTIFAGTRTPLSVWFAAAWHFVTRRRTPTATGLQRSLGIGRYETAWEMLRALRYATVAPDRPKLSGRVEVAPFRLPAAAERPIAIAVETSPTSELGSARLAALPQLSMAAVRTFMNWAVDPEAEVTLLPAAEWRPQQPKLPGPRKVGAQLSRWIRPAAIAPGRTHPAVYLEEFAFRFALRSFAKGEQFHELLHNAVRVSAPPWSVSDKIAWPHDLFRDRRTEI